MSARSNTFRWAVISLMLVITCSRAFAGKTLYVDDDGPADFNNIQAAIDDSNDGDIVIVANGTYTGDGNRDIDFLGKAITLRSENAPESCIIDCNGTEADPHRGFYFHSGEDANSVLDGFTITNGYGLKEQFVSQRWSFGGAIYCKRSGPTIINCVITGNKAIQGAGVFAYENSNPQIAKSTISENSGVKNGGGGGGGIYCWDNSIVLIADCVISGNDGRGIFCRDSIGIEISNCEISNNRMDGIDFNCDGPWVISNCTISGNQGPGIHCSAFDDGMISNCIISDNTTTIAGGGIRVGTYNDSIVMINNCTISGNSADMGGGVCCSYGNTIVTNSIVWNNNGGDIYLYNHPPAPYDGYTMEPTKLSVSYSCPGIIIEDPSGGGPILMLGDGNIDKDPCFADPNNGDYHLKSQAGRWDPNSQSWVQDAVTSPCIDAGDMSSPIGFEPFPNGGIINMGAYGGTAEAGKSYFGQPLCKIIIAGDINGDCRVDFADFAIMAAHWLECGPPIRRVEVTDIKIIRGELVEGRFQEIDEVDKLIVGDVFRIRIEVSNLGSETVHVFNLYGWDLSPQNYVEVIGTSVPCAAIYDLEPGESAFLGPFCLSQAFKAKKEGWVTMNIRVNDWYSSRLCERTFTFEVLSVE